MKNRKIIAGLLSMAVLMQGAAALPHLAPQPLRAEAAFVKSIQTRIFEYDFDDFRVLYDTRTGTWYTEEGSEILTNISVCPIAAGDAKASVNFSDGRIIANDASGKENKALEQRIKEKVLDPVLAVVPEYQPEFYDRAQQKNIAVPKPVSFPLTYRIETGTDGYPLKCVILFGEYVYGTCLFSDSAESLLDPDAALTDADMLFVRNGAVGNADPFTDAGDTNIDGEKDVADAVLTSRFLVEDAETPMSDLGRELADRNNDGNISGADVHEVLIDITGVPDETRPEVVPANGVEVLKLTETKTFPVIAETFGFESAYAMEERFMKMNSDTWSLFRCTQGFDTDVWQIAYLSTHIPEWNTVALQDMTLTDGTLQIHASAYNWPESAWSPAYYTMWTMTVPHGTMPADAYVSWNLEYSETPLRTSQVHYISVENADGVRLDNISGSFGTELDSPEFSRPRFSHIQGIAPDDAYRECISGKHYYAEQFLDQSETDDPELRVRLAGGQDVIRIYLENYGTNAKAYGLKSAQIGADGTLYLDMAVLYPYLRIEPCSTVNRFDLCCKDGALPKFENIVVNLREYNTDLEAVPHEVEEYGLQDEYDAFLADTRMTVYVQQGEEQPVAESIRADVQAEPLPDDQPVPACMCDPENMTGTEDTVEIYRTAADTEDTGLQEILNGGKDIIAYYYYGPTCDMQFGAENATLYPDGTLVLTVADMDGVLCAMQIYRVLLITDDGALPEHLKVLVDEHKFDEVYLTPEGEMYDLTQDFNAAICDPLYIKVQSDIPENTVIRQAKSECSTYSGLWETWTERYGYSPEITADTPPMQISWDLMEGPTTDELEIRFLQKENLGCRFEIQELYYRDGVLHVVAGEYCTRSLNSTASTFFCRGLTVRHGTFDRLQSIVLDVLKTEGYADAMKNGFPYHGKGWEYFTADLPETLTVQKGDASDGIYAAVQVKYDCNPPQENMPKIDSWDTVFYRSAADTDNAELQEILDQGKDVLAVRFKCSNGSMHFGVEDAVLSADGTLRLQTARHIPTARTCDCPVYQIWLVTDAGALPENLTVELTEQIYEDSGYQDTYPEFRANTHNPVFICVE